MSSVAVPTRGEPSLRPYERLPAPTLWSVDLPSVNHQGWGRFVLSSDGYFSCVTDFGNYAFWWTHAGPNDFRRFLLRVNDDYLMGKLHHGLVYDGEKTEKLLKEHLTELRRDREISKDEARNLWDYLGEAGLEDESGYHNLCHLHALEDLSEGEEQLLADLASFGPCFSHHGDLLGFVKHVWPRFCAALREALEEESREQDAPFRVEETGDSVRIFELLSSAASRVEVRGPPDPEREEIAAVERLAILRFGKRVLQRRNMDHEARIQRAFDGHDAIVVDLSQIEWIDRQWRTFIAKQAAFARKHGKQVWVMGVNAWRLGNQMGLKETLRAHIDEVSAEQ